jgi:hypothetical protein
MKQHSTEYRLALVKRVATWCFSNTESWWGSLGEGLAYLFWAIASDDAFDLSVGALRYVELVQLLQKNGDLWQTLVTEGFIVTKREQR